MAIIDQAMAQQAPQPSAPQTPQAPPAAAAPGAGPKTLSEPAKDVLLAVYGMLYDKRVAAGDKLAQQIKASRDPVAVIAQSAYDIVLSASEKLNVDLPPPEMRAVVKVALARIGEIGKAVGIQLTAADAEEAVAMLAERDAERQQVQQGQQAQPPQDQPAPEQQEPMA